LRQTRLERRVRAGLRDRADMQLVDDELLPRMTLPIVVLPLVIQWIHEHAGCMHAFRTETRCRIRYLQRIIDAGVVTIPRSCLRDARVAPAVAAAPQRLLPEPFRAEKLQCDTMRARRPQAKVSGA